MKLIFSTLFLIIICLPKYILSQSQDSVENATSSLFNNESNNNSNNYQYKLEPRAISFVADYIKKNRKELDKMKSWGRSYFNLYDGILREYNIPIEMKYLSVIESHLRSNLVSWAGAVGPWQIMSYEAKRLGLKVGRVDERTDYIKSTHAASKLMKELYNEFGDWLLVVAGYNGGSGRVRSAIRKSGSNNFWNLQYYLPEETRTHVKKFIATHYLFEGDGGITTQTAAKNKEDSNNYSFTIDKETLANMVSIEVKGRYKSDIICNSLGLHPNEFKIINHKFDAELAEGKTFYMKIPKEKEVLFQTIKNQILEQSIRSILEGK